MAGAHGLRAKIHPPFSPLGLLRSCCANGYKWILANIVTIWPFLLDYKQKELAKFLVSDARDYAFISRFRTMPVP